MTELLIAVGLAVIAVIGSYRFAMQWTFNGDTHALSYAAMSPMVTVAPFAIADALNTADHLVIIIVSLLWIYIDALKLIGLGASAHD